MRSGRLSLVSVAWLGACTTQVVDDSHAGPDAFVPFAASGERIEHWGWTASGVGVHVETRDSELGVACSFVRAEDGELRCVPAGLFGLAKLFTDASCSEAGALYFDPALEPCAGPAAIGQLVEGDMGDGCEGAVWVADALAEAEPPAEVYWPDGMGGCAPTGSPPIGPYYAPTRIDPSALVRGERVEELADNGVGVAVIVGDDGSRLVVGPADSRFAGAGARVEALVQPAGLRLVPEVVARPSVVFSPECGAEPIYEVAECVFEQLGAVIDEGRAYTPGPVVAYEDIEAGGCSEFAPDSMPGIVHVRAGEPLADDALTELEPEVLEPSEGEGVSARVLRTATGERLFADEAPFEADGALCTPWQTVERPVCLSDYAEPIAPWPYFADAACTAPVVIDTGENGLLGPGDVVWEPAASACGSSSPVIAAIWRVGGLESGPVFFQSDLGCVEETLAEGWFPLEPIELGSLPSLTYGRL